MEGLGIAHLFEDRSFVRKSEQGTLRRQVFSATGIPKTAHNELCEGLGGPTLGCSVMAIEIWTRYMLCCGGLLEGAGDLVSRL